MNAHTPAASAATEATFTISRYPSALIDVRTLRDRSRLTLRPVLPQDDVLLAELIGRVSRASLRNRFHGAVNGVSASRLAQMSCVDYRQHFACVVTTLEGGRETIVADARYCVDDGTDDERSGSASSIGESAEFALLVDDRWQRRSLGAWALAALAEAARSAGLRWLHGDVLAGNLPMLALMRRSGFCCTPDRADDRLVRAEKRLDAARAPALHEPRLAWLPRWLPGGFAAAAAARLQ